MNRAVLGLVVARFPKGKRAMRNNAHRLELAVEMWDYERAVVGSEVSFAGVDEAGRGALAGPVVAAAVILGGRPEDWLDVRDSKQVSKKRRAELSALISERAAAVAVGTADESEIEQLNILHAARVAMGRAIAGLSTNPQMVLVDGPFPPLFMGPILPSLPIVDGDAICISIAAASIVAKVARDAMMEELDTQFPDYHFSRNAGYPTPHHLSALDRIGPCPVHRMTFTPVQRASQLRIDFGW